MCERFPGDCRANQLIRLVYLKPPVEHDGQYGGKTIWRLIKRLYGLNDASRGWYLKVVKELEDLGCEVMQLDKSIFVLRDQNNTLQGVLAVHIDDFIYGGSNYFYKKVVKGLKKTFKVGEAQAKMFTSVASAGSWSRRVMVRY